MTPRDDVAPASPVNGEAVDVAASPAPKRSGSQNRQRNKSWRIALTDEEEARALESAADVGLSRSSYGRAALLGAPGPRAQRTPPVNAEALARAVAALNKVGSLLNQIARVLNAGGAIALANECSAALAEIRDAARSIREAVGRKDRANDNQRE